MLDLERILSIIRGAANAAVALDGLVEVIAENFGESDQARLKAAYAEARAASDDAHEQLQADLAAAAKR